MTRRFIRGVSVCVACLTFYVLTMAALCRHQRKQVNAIIEAATRLPPTNPVVRTRSNIVERNGQIYIHVESNPSP